MLIMGTGIAADPNVMRPLFTPNMGWTKDLLLWKGLKAEMTLAAHQVKAMRAGAAHATVNAMVRTLS